MGYSTTAFDRSIFSLKQECVGGGGGAEVKAGSSSVPLLL